MSIITSCAFTIVMDHANDQITMTDTTDYSGTGSQTVLPVATTDGTMTIIDPNGNNYNILIDPSLAYTGSTAISILDAGEIPKGTWSFSFNVIDTTGGGPGGANTDATATASLNYQYSTGAASLTMVYNYAVPELKSTEASTFTYNNITGVQSNIVHNLYYPLGLAATITETDNAILTSAVYAQTGVVLQYSADISIDLTFTLDAQFTITDTVVDTEVYDVTDGAALCSTYCCIASKITAYEAAKCTNLAVAEDHLADFILMTSYLGAIKQAIECGKSADVNAYRDAILDIGNCTEDCACDDDAPVLVTGLGGSAASADTIAIVVAGTNITVVSNTVGATTTYTVNLGGTIVANIATNVTNIATNVTNIGINTTAIAALAAPDRMNFVVEFAGMNALSAINATPVLAVAQLIKTGTYFDGTPTVALETAGVGFYTGGQCRFILNLNSTNIAVGDFPQMTCNKVSALYGAGFPGYPTSTNTYDHQIDIRCDIQIDETDPNIVYITPQLSNGTSFQRLNGLGLFLSPGIDNIKLSITIEK